MRWVHHTGFEAYDDGSLAEPWRQQPGTPAYCTELALEDFGQALAAAQKDKSSCRRDRLMERMASLH
ncbi:hypothetical protein VUN82_10485 [Micrococcaceae bacterium Sec5.1]